MPCVLITNLPLYLYLYIYYFGQEIHREKITVLQKRLCYEEMTCLEDFLNTAIKKILYLRTKAW